MADADETTLLECEAEETDEGPEGGGAGWEVPVKVLPMSPNLMLEKMTWAFGLWDSTCAGTPEVVGHVPRATPGEDASLFVG